MQEKGMAQPHRVSVHGGHSGQFCHHATGSLEEIILEYIRQDFTWVGITEHVPPLNKELQYLDEKEAGLSPAFLLDRFKEYILECRRLQNKYQAQIQIYAAMEIETYSGYAAFADMLVERFAPDYIVGSVHFVNDINFDYSAELYRSAAESVGGIEQLYCRYFDEQFDMIEKLKPAVVGHFDLVRIFDPEYRTTITSPEIQKRIRRNLELIKDLDLIMDYNLRALAKGAQEPYITSSILAQASELGIAVVPGDDSHSVASVGNYIDLGIRTLQEYGFTPKWRTPHQSS
jgi:histidinol-phosphatase (PHP family)